MSNIGDCRDIADNFRSWRQASIINTGDRWLHLQNEAIELYEAFPDCHSLIGEPPGTLDFVTQASFLAFLAQKRASNQNWPVLECPVMDQAEEQRHVLENWPNFSELASKIRSPWAAPEETSEGLLGPMKVKATSLDVPPVFRDLPQQCQAMEEQLIEIRKEKNKLDQHHQLLSKEVSRVGGSLKTLKKVRTPQGEPHPELQVNLDYQQYVRNFRSLKTVKTVQSQNQSFNPGSP